MIASNPLELEIIQSPLLKVDRAKKHVNDLNQLVTEYLAAKPFRLRIKQSANPPERLIYVQTHPSLAEDLALIVGDAVHNLRTALDHLCYGMVGDKAKRPGGVGFPFAKDGKSLASTIATRQMNVAPEEVIHELHALKPYPGGNDHLYAVKALDERDKHHFIVTVGVAMEFTPTQFGSLVGPEKVAHLPPGMRFSGVGDFLVKMDQDSIIESFDQEADFQPPFTIGFGQEEPFGNLPIIPALKKMTAATEDAILRLASAFA